jgi:hypothetical protein
MTAPLPADLPIPPAALPSLRLSGPSDLVAAVPHLLGFAPQLSLVVVALRRPPRAAPRIEATLRVDLTDDPVAQVEPFLHSVRDQGAHDVVVLAYPGVGGEPWSWDELVDDLRGVAEAADLEVADVLRVETRRGGWRYWSLQCRNPQCCPAEGRHVSADAPVVAEAVGRGLVALASRGDVEAELQTDVCRMLDVTAALRGRRVGRTDAWRRRELAWADALLTGELGPPVAPRDAARLLTALRDVRVRDALLVTPGATADRSQQVWADLARAAPSRLRAAPATLLAASHLATGGGVRATVALEVALRADPGYTLAGLLHRAVVAAVPPRELVRLLVAAAEVERGLRSGVGPAPGRAADSG